MTTLMSILLTLIISFINYLRQFKKQQDVFYMAYIEFSNLQQIGSLGKRIGCEDQKWITLTWNDVELVLQFANRRNRPI